MAVMAAAVSVQALDFPLGSVPITDSSVPKIKVFLDLRENKKFNYPRWPIDTYVTTNGVQYTITNAPARSTNDVHVSGTSRVFEILVPESYGDRLQRRVREGGWIPLKARFLEWAKQTKIDAAIAAIPDEPDPEKE